MPDDRLPDSRESSAVSVSSSSSQAGRRREEEEVQTAIAQQQQQQEQRKKTRRRSAIGARWEQRHSFSLSSLSVCLLPPLLSLRWSLRDWMCDQKEQIPHTRLHDFPSSPLALPFVVRSSLRLSSNTRSRHISLPLFARLSFFPSSEERRKKREKENGSLSMESLAVIVITISLPPSSLASEEEARRQAPARDARRGLESASDEEP